MFFEQFDDEVNNLLDNTNIYNIKGDNWFSQGLRPLTLTTSSVFKILLFLSMNLQFKTNIFMDACPHYK